MFKQVFVAPVLVILLGGCVTDKEVKTPAEGYVSAFIVGSAENPDPVIERVLELKQQGVITNLSIMESYPVQLKFDAPKEVVEELESIPRQK